MPTAQTTDSRQRVQDSLNHKQPAKLPIDFGSTAVTGVHVSVVADLREYYGLEKRPVKVHEPYQMLGLVDEDLKDAMGIDTTGVFGRNTLFGFPNDAWKPWTFNGREVLVSDKFNTITDEKGDTLIFPEGDMSAKPSGRMPKDGYFFDTIVRQEHFNEDALNPADNLEEFKELSESDIAWIKSSVAAVQHEGRAVVMSVPGTAFGDIALVPAPFLKDPKGVRDIAEWYMSTSARKDYVHAIFSRQCEIALKNLERIHGAVGNTVDAVFLCGTDFGTQVSTFCSLRNFRELWMPYYSEVCSWIRKNTTWRCFKHSCGAVEKFIDSLIESGFDILNPVQCSATGMDPEHLKAKYGDRIVFWGGGVDTQKTLPFGTAEEVREQVLRRCEVFGKDGGFIFNSIHNIQARTPVENVVAMLDAVKEYNGQR
jgi:hypothetical protein